MRQNESKFRCVSGNVMMATLFILFTIYQKCTTDLPAAEFQVMNALKAAITPIDPSWNGGISDPCVWDGVSCNSDGTANHVIALTTLKLHLTTVNRNLRFSERFTITFPDTISDLPYLANLTLYNCSLQNPLPDALSGTSLATITISYCDNVVFPKVSPLINVISITTSWSNVLELPSSTVFPNLIGLTINQSPTLNDTLDDLMLVTTLSNIAITNTNLRGNIPNTIGNVGQLVSLDLSFNQLDGTIPNELASIKRLGRLRLKQNKLTGGVPSVLTALQVVDLSRNMLTGDISSFAMLSTVTYLDLSSNNLTGPIPSFDNWSSLNYLDLARNQFSGTLPNVTSLSQLGYLNLGNNNLEGTIPTQISSLTSMQSLDLSHNKLNGTIPDMSSLLALTYFNAAFNNFTGPVPLFKSSVLTTVLLANNQLTGFVPDMFGPLTSLTLFSLNRNNLIGWLPLSVFNRSFTLDIGFNSIGGCSPTSQQLANCLAEGNNFCCSSGTPSCSTFNNKCLVCPTAPPSASADCVYNEKGQLVWVWQGDIQITNSTVIDGVVIDGNLIIVTDVEINSAIINGNLSINGDLTVGSGVITVAGCANINGSLTLNLTPEEIDQLEKNGTLIRPLLYQDIVCNTSDVNFRDITVNGDLGCSDASATKQSSPGAITLLVQYNQKQCPLDNSPVQPDALPNWAIAIIVVGCVLVAGGVIAGILLSKRKKLARESQKFRSRLTNSLSAADRASVGTRVPEN